MYGKDVWFGLVCWSLTSLCHSIDMSRPCQPEKSIPLLPGPGFDPSFSGHNDRRAIISEWTRLRLRPLSHRGLLRQRCEVTEDVSVSDETPGDETNTADSPENTTSETDFPHTSQ